MENNLFSIIIPTFNRSKSLARALDSLTKQDYCLFEVIIADDGSLDDTSAVIKNFEGKLNLKYIWNPNWGGPARPRNIAASVAKGDWLCFLDADDYYYPTKLSTMKNYSVGVDNDVIAHPLDIIGHDFKKKGIADAKDISRKNPFLDLMTNGNKFPNSGTMVRRSIFEKVGGYREDARLIAVEDFDLLIRISQVTNRFKVVKTVLGAYNLGQDQISGISEKYIEAIKAVFADYQVLLDFHGNIESKALVNYLIGTIYLSSGKKINARDYFVKSLNRKNLFWVIKSLIRIIQSQW